MIWFPTRSIAARVAVLANANAFKRIPRKNVRGTAGVTGTKSTDYLLMRTLRWLERKLIGVQSAIGWISNAHGARYTLTIVMLPRISVVCYVSAATVCSATVMTIR